MAVTTQTATPMNPVKSTYSSAIEMTRGIAQLSSGTVSIVTGLSQVHGMVCTACESTNTEAVCFRVMADLPTTTGTVTVDGVKLDEGAAVANAGSEYFCWIAWGRA